MRPHRTRRILALLIAAASPSTALAISGGSLALKSTGSNVINQNGYVGTYITLAAPATVTLTVNAQSASGGGATPHMNIVVDDSVTGFDVGTSAGGNAFCTYGAE
jgi:hypothetical protein